MTPVDSRLRRVRRGYRVAALLLLNTLVAFLLVEGMLSVIIRIKDRRAAVVDMYDGLDDATLAKLYPHHGRHDVERLWQDVVQPLAYESFTEFQERPRATPWVNVDAAGFRHVAQQGPWPPDPHRTNVFVFGGSTTFGYGVADDDTLPSRLQPLLAQHRAELSVYNFGRGYYYSTQERLLFEQLVSAGHVPAVAIFIDGLNEFCFERDDSAVSPRLAAALSGNSQVSFVDWLMSTPLGRAVAFARTRLGADDTERDGTVPELGADVIRHIIDRYLANKRLIESVSAAYGVTPIFVWQPVPMYKYEARHHLFAGRGFFGVTPVRHGYEAMAEAVRAHPLGGDFVWLADVQADAHDPLYVDVVHYAPPFMERLAALIDGAVGDVVAQARPGSS